MTKKRTMLTVAAIREALAEPKPIEFFAAGNPKGQPRPRAFSRGGRASVYDPGTAEGWKSCIAVAARPHIPATPIAGPVRLVLWFAMPRPKGHYRTNGVLKENFQIHHTSKPDCDNLAKAVLDAMTVLRFWNDDDQVCSLEVHKVYGERPGVSVKVEVAQ